VHRRDSDHTWGPSGCTNCGWRGVPSWQENGLPDDRCPRCELAAETQAEWEALKKKEEYRGTGRNEPCPCGSGKKFKKCHGA
jgi:hypothetical protein